MVSNLFLLGRIRTTPAKAKEVRSMAEKLITLGREGRPGQLPQRARDPRRQVHRPQALQGNRPSLQGPPGRLHPDPAPLREREPPRRQRAAGDPGTAAGGRARPLRKPPEPKAKARRRRRRNSRSQVFLSFEEPAGCRSANSPACRKRSPSRTSWKSRPVPTGASSRRRSRRRAGRTSASKRSSARCSPSRATTARSRWSTSATTSAARGTPRKTAGACA